MQIIWMLLAIYAVSAFAPVSAEGLLPSEATTLMVRAMNHHPGAERRSLTRPIIERMKTSDLEDIERFLSAEAYFLHFEPESARDGFREFRHRNDDIGRVARQRLAIIRINAFRMVDEVVDEDVPGYRKTFPVSAHDRYGMSYPLMQAARLLAERGEPHRALDLIADEVKRHHRFDAPYHAYRLPGVFMELAEQYGREDEFRALESWVVDGVAAEIDRRLGLSPVPGRLAYSLPGSMLGTLFEDERLNFHDWTAEFLDLHATLQQSDSTD